MKVQIVRPTIAQKRQVMPGDMLDVSQTEAVILIGAGKAVAVKETIETATAPAAEKANAPVPKTSQKPIAQKTGEKATTQKSKGSV